MNPPEPWQAPSLSAAPAIAHGFFSRRGGVSTGLYDSLNCGTGSNDDRASVLSNRATVANVMGIAPDRLLSLYQIHSPDIVTLEHDTPLWQPGQGPKADGMVTREPGLGLGVLAADCTPILFADADAGVIGACHAGWKGALGGVADATVAAMEALGASNKNIVAAIGPTIRQPSYEVGAEFRDRFIDADRANADWFIAGADPGKFHFDLPGYLTQRLRDAGVAHIEDAGICTYANANYFSYRRTTHRREPDYGRNISVIALKGRA